MLVLPLVVAVAGNCRCSDDPSAPAPESPAVGSVEFDDAAVEAAPSGQIGSESAPQYPRRVNITDDPLPTPMRPEELMAIPGGELAAASGPAGEQKAVQLIDLRAGRVVWTDTQLCPGKLVHTTATRVICANAQRINALNADDGRSVWTAELRFRAAHEDRLVAQDEASGQVFVIDTDDNNVVFTAELPEPSEIGAVCARGDAIDLYAWSPSGEVRAYRSEGESLVLGWQLRLPGVPSRAEVCGREQLLFEVPRPGIAVRQLIAVARSTGVVVGGPLSELGWWHPPEGNGLVVADRSGVHAYSDELVQLRTLYELAPAGRLVAARDELRLVRSVAGSVVLLDRRGVRAWLGAPAHPRDVVLGADRMLAAGWVGAGSRGERLALYELPPLDPGSTWPQPVRIAPPAPGLPASSVPKATPIRSQEIPFREVPARGGGPLVVAGERLYVSTISTGLGPEVGAGVAAFDLRERRWLWHQPAGCAPNAQPVALVEAGDTVVCAARENDPGPVWLVGVQRATGAPRWRVPVRAVDYLAATGGFVVVTEGAETLLLDAATGALSEAIPSDNGHRTRAIATSSGIVAVGSGGVVTAHNPSEDAPARWRLAVGGYVAAVARVGEAAAVALATGELYVIDSIDGSVHPVHGWHPGTALQSAGDLLLQQLELADRPDGAQLSAASLQLVAYGADGNERFRAGFPQGAYRLVVARTGASEAPLMFSEHSRAPRILVLDPMTGRVIAVHVMPRRASAEGLFGAAIDGKPLAGVVLWKPLAIKLL